MVCIGQGEVDQCNTAAGLVIEDVPRDKLMVIYAILMHRDERIQDTLPVHDNKCERWCTGKKAGKTNLIVKPY